jgi:hypothetical protein
VTLLQSVHTNLVKRKTLVTLKSSENNKIIRLNL